ncbi:MAG: Asp-tRNA(Asn)/Glu-tRNA(Gln) amidotransferase subunit GatB, partial [Clostridia bacterium]|nr:Asp-tRNA(Asn)/Glu-tRNA(Gln) amidotransferase subunit GatB [Clostridia bacterium]
MNYETVIGLEIHAELRTESKMFCGCSTAFGAEPNTQCCPVCTGQPGALPLVNRKAATYGILAGLGTNCTIAKTLRFDRKNYFYPDLPKGYQISQLYEPLCQNGYLALPESGKIIRIREIHLEEDAGKLVHDRLETESLCDYNRCGVPLIEIVTQPDFSTAEEVCDFVRELRRILLFLGISDGKMQEGSLRVDVNLSVRPVGEATLGTRTEMKNLNSLRAIRCAIDAEAKRQIARLSQGNAVIQETRRWDETTGATLSMRAKEEQADYRYFPEPDL